jgi:CSLREA domain-containing protein
LANYGGGIHNNGTLTVTNSTISGNSANNNGGGIYNDAGSALNIANTIIANSTDGASTPTPIDDYAGAGTSTVNLIGASTAANNLVTQGTFNWATTVTSAALNLGPLQNNGGPTFTMALLAGSPAISAGNATISNAAPVNRLDQRGFSRITSDIGAYAVSNIITVTSTADTVDPTDGVTSLREAITLANTTAGDDQISFNFSTVSSSYTITLNSALPNIIDASTVVGTGTAGTLTINGLGASSLIISGNNGNVNRDFNIFNIASGGNLSISGVTVSGAQTSHRFQFHPLRQFGEFWRRHFQHRHADGHELHHLREFGGE